MAKSKVSSVMRTQAEGYLDLDGSEIAVEIDEVGKIPLRDLLRRYNGELVKISVAVSSDGYDPAGPDDEGDDIDTD
jgi:hypothetical protein